MVIIKEDLLPIGTNRPGTSLQAQGIVVHSTATLGADAIAESKYFHGGDRGASAHLFVDWTPMAIKTIPLSEVAWHAGPSANHKYLGIELCETSDPAKWQSSLVNLLDVLEEIFESYSWPVNDNTLWSHARISQTFKETNHQDPLAYFQSHGYSMDQLKSDLAERLSK